ncbi:hypothetical protein [Streptomyces sp. NPDC048659]|uniref:hypothetical protein n=1 Tax=Streptomyces sp. NPDC048659 TaxID=3155489 RepID=UPI003429FD8C
MGRAGWLVAGGAGAVLTAGVVAAVHGGGRPPLAVALWADALLALGWCWAGAAWARRRRGGAARPGGPSGTGARHRAEGEPLARDRWGNRHRR